MTSPRNQYNARDFMREIEKSLPGQIYLFTGEEEGLKEKCAARIFELLEKKYGKNGVVLSRFHAESGDLLKFYEFTLSPSMFTPSKLAVLSGTHAIQVTNENKRIFSESFSILPATSVIILFAEGYAIPKIIPKEYHDKLIHVKFWRFFQNDAEKYIMQSLQKLKIKYDHDALQCMITLLGNDVKKIDDAIEKISFSGHNTITRDFLLDFLFDERESNVFEFIDSLLEKSPHSLRILHSLLLDGVYELSILALLVRNIENLLFYHKATAEGKTPSEIMNVLGIKEKQQQKFINHANHFTRTPLEKIFTLIHEAEDKIKGGWQYKSLLSNPLVELTEKIISIDKNL